MANNNNTLVLSDLTLEVSDYVAQFETYLGNRNVWRGTLTTMTSQTLIELVSTVGTFIQGRLTRAYEDAFSETAQSDDAIRSITQMQGLRMSRKLPAGVEAEISSPTTVTVPPMTQFMIGGQYYFNRSQIVLQSNIPQLVTLFQGQVFVYAMYGAGGPRQTYLSEEDEFSVSDQDVVVRINGVAIEKSFGNLWNYKNLPAWGDLTTSDGRLLVVFGSQQFGTTPLTTDRVTITYPITLGAEASNIALIRKKVTVTGFSTITGEATSNPTGGGNEQPINAYKNLSSGAFGTYTSAVTKSQYLSTVGVYPGIIDAVTQAQRDINPMAFEWMNVIRVSGLTTSTWTQQQKKDFITYLQKVTMYAGRFVWYDAVPVYRNVSMTVYVFNTAILSQVQADCEKAMQELFAPRPGLLLTNFYESDLTDVTKTASKGMQSYAIVDFPLSPMIVTAPLSPDLRYEIVENAGTLGSLAYAYGVSTVNAAGEEGPPANWVFPQIVSANAVYAIELTWPELPDTTQYKVWGRNSTGIGLMAVINQGQPMTFTDNGSIVPDTSIPLPGSANIPIRYNALGTLDIRVEFAERQQRLSGTPTRGQ